MELDYKNFKGVLSKKSPKPLGGWQKRFFRVVEGKVIVYSEKENDKKPKGHIQISQISKAISVEKKVLSFSLEGRDFVLKAEDEASKDKWIQVINRCIDEELKATSKKPLPSPHEPGEESKRSNTVSSHKMDNLDKSTLDLLKNHGMMNTEEAELSKTLLAKKGIDKLLNFKDTKIEPRIHYGFLFKHHKSKNYFQKRWFFIFSSRPLTNEKYEIDDVSLDEKKKKEWLKFDTLFYFKYENDKASSTKCQGELDLSLSHKIESVEKDNKYYLILDVEDRVFEFYSEMKGERDKWFEVLKNSRRTAKEYQASITKHPKNVQILSNILTKDGQNKLKDKLEEEKNKIIGDYTKM